MPRLSSSARSLIALLLLGWPARPAPAQVIINNAGPGLVIVGQDNIPGIAETRPDPAGPHVIEFFDGRQLHGTLEALDMEHRQLLWRRRDAATPLVIPLRQVSRLNFDRADHQADLHATIKFLGGDWLAAEITRIQDNKIHLHLADGVDREVDRAQVDWIYFSQGPAPECYEGPTGLSGWVSGGSWSYRDGALRASMPSPIGRNFASLPDQVEYQFEVDQGRLMDAFNFSLHGRVGQEWNAGPGVVQCVVQANTLNVWAMTSGRFKSEPVDLEPIIGGAMDGRIKHGKSNPVRFRIFEDFPGGRLLIFINDHKAGEWNIGKGEAGKNRGSFTFQPTVWNPNREQTLSKIRVAPWDGRVPAEAAPSDGTPDDLVSLADGTTHAGKFIDFALGTLRIRSDNKTFETPRDQVRLLRFGGSKEAADDASSTARIRLTQGGDLDASQVGWRDGKFQIRTRFGVEVAVPPSAVTELRFSQSAPMLALAGDTLVFKDGDELQGRLEAAGADQKLRWRTDDAASTDFSLAHLAGVRLGAPPTEPGGRIDCVARFRNGDWLAGRFLTLDKQELVLETRDAGQLSIARPLLRTLYFSKDGTLPISDGVADDQEWLRGLDVTSAALSGMNKGFKPASLWKCFDGVYSLNTPESMFTASRVGGIQVGRLLPNLPTLAEISFDASGRGGQIVFSAQLFSEAGSPGYLLQFNSQGLAIFDLNPGARGHGNLGPQQAQFENKLKPNANQRHIQLLANRETGQLTVLVDGVVITHFGNKSGTAPRQLGHGVMLSPQPGLSGTFSNIWVGPWNGQVPGEAAGPGQVRETAVLNNGDEAEGSVELATPSSVKLASDIGPLDLAVDRLTMIDFGGPAPEKSPGTRLHLAALGTLTVKDCQVKEGTVNCRSEVAGDLKIPLAALREVVFASPAKGP